MYYTLSRRDIIQLISGIHIVVMFFIYLHILMPLPPCLLLLADTLTLLLSCCDCTWSHIPANCHTYLGYFLLIFGLDSRLVTHSLIVTHFADLPLILMIFATHYSTLLHCYTYRLRVCCEIGLPQNKIGPHRSLIVKKVGWQVCYHRGPVLTLTAQMK